MTALPQQELLNAVEAGRLRRKIDAAFHLDQIVQAQCCSETNMVEAKDCRSYLRPAQRGFISSLDIGAAVVEHDLARNSALPEGH